MDNPLVSLSKHLAEMVSRAAQAVVTVHARPRITSSGVVWAPGLVVTADHAITRNTDIHLTLADGSQVEAKLAGRDGATDLALLEFADAGHATVPQAGEAPAAGSLLLAVGRNADTGATASMGILSASGGEFRTWRGGVLDRFLRLDMGLHPGSSGGIVVDMQGNLVGIASSALSRLSPLAIPASTVGRVVEELRTRGRVGRAYLGVGVQPVKLGDGSSGLIVLSVEAESAAEKAGILVGDIVVTFHGAPAADLDDLQQALTKLSAGDTVEARLVRGGQVVEQSIVLGERNG